MTPKRPIVDDINAGRVAKAENTEATRARLTAYFRRNRKKDTYHGIRIPKPFGKSRFTDAELRDAVEAAIIKNAHLFTPHIAAPGVA